MRTLPEIRADIERTSEQRAELLRLLAQGFDAGLAAEHRGLDKRLDQLWDEQRAARARLRFGERESILARARTEERLSRAA